MDVASKGFLGASIPEDLAHRIDRFVEKNDWAYRSRAEVLVAAVREFLQRHEMEPQADTLQEETQERAEKGREKRKH